MIRKYVFGHPFETEAVVEEIAPSEGVPAYGEIKNGRGICFQL